MDERDDFLYKRTVNNFQILPLRFSISNLLKDLFFRRHVTIASSYVFGAAKFDLHKNTYTRRSECA